ncbi:hypothetical protein BD289DRAFT_63458 [Coniella lustricola]|uniref:Uncharacterized protein n=1 Tax=Coniella lustricola TaxID=2025994 RepID=A0A2T3A0B6_9PEZI|nr:hypothetical protein BD289DRAFT_63458 [Coniella lustricola]
MSGPRSPIPDPGWPPRRSTPHPRIRIPRPEPIYAAVRARAKAAQAAQAATGFRSIPYDRTIMAIPPRRDTTDQAFESSSTPATAAPNPATAPTAAGHFDLPASFTLFNRTHLHLHSRIYLATSKDEPLYRVHSSWDRVLLRSGPRPNDPILATLRHKGLMKSLKGHVMLAHGMKQLVTLRRLYGFTIEVPVPVPVPTTTTSDDGHDTKQHTNNNVSNGVGCRTRIEAFEWRRSRGSAVKLLGRGSGYKLVRFATDAGNGGGEIATGGGEVVAVLAMGKPWQ